MKAVLFDMDGVLIDSEIHYVEGTLDFLKGHGYKGDFKSVTIIIGTTMEETYKLLCSFLDNKYPLDEIIKMYDNYFVEHPLSYKDLKKPYALECLKMLKDKNIKTAVCSSSPKDNIEHVLEVCGFNEYVDFAISGDECSNSKPDPKIYLHACKVLNVLPEDCVIIEDSKIGIDAAKAANIETIALEDDRLHHDQSKADLRFASFEEISAYLSTKI